MLDFRRTLRLGFVLLISGTVGPAMAESGEHRWQRLGLAVESVLAVAFDPWDFRRLFAGVSNGPFYRSENGGRRWEAFPAGFSNDAVLSLAVDPSTPSTLYAVGVFALAIDPEHPDTLFMTAGGRAVLRSNDGGATWESWCRGLASQLTSELVIVPRIRTVLAANETGVYSRPIYAAQKVLSLQGDRFRVQVAWRDFEDRRGVGTAAVIGEGAGLAASDDSGLFYFFDEDNWELLVKVLDGCALNGHFWVFAAATTNVEYRLVVTDTAKGETKTYTNPLGVASPATTDTAAFATCDARP